MGDWIFDHFGWLLAATAVAVAGFVIWAVAAGALNGPACPPGQREVLLYEIPVTSTVNNVPITTMVPIYGCEK
jgi:hypothetical protein